MKENVLEVLMYIFENYADDEAGLSADQETLMTRLSQAGFGEGEIRKAFAWLEDLSTMCDEKSPSESAGKQHSVRHYSSEEKRRLAPGIEGFMLRLEHRGVLDPVTRELVIDRLMALDTDELDLEQLKWVVMMVLYNQPNGEAIHGWVEDFLYEETHGNLH